MRNVKIIGEIVTRIRGPDLLSMADVNGDGIIDIVDIVIVALCFGWEENGQRITAKQPSFFVAFSA